MSARAWAQSNERESLVRVDSSRHIAKGKGVIARCNHPISTG